MVVYKIDPFLNDLWVSVTKATIWRRPPGLLYLHSFVAKQRAILLWIKILDSLLYAAQVMPPNDYICDELYKHLHY